MHADIDALSHLASIEKGWSDTRRIEVAKEYQCYLEKAASGMCGSPSLDVDALWHLHILNTTSYVRYCEETFGRYIHHLACVPKEIVPALKERLANGLPEFMPVAEKGEGPKLIADCGTPAQCGGDSSSMSLNNVAARSDAAG